MPDYCAIHLNKSTNYLEKFSLPSFLLEKIQRGGRESMAAAKLLLPKGHLSQDCVLIVDERYLQKGT